MSPLLLTYHSDMLYNGLAASRPVNAGSLGRPADGAQSQTEILNSAGAELERGLRLVGTPICLTVASSGRSAQGACFGKERIAPCSFHKRVSPWPACWQTNSNDKGPGNHMFGNEES